MYRGTLIIITNKQVNHPDPILAQDLPGPRPYAGHAPAVPHGRKAVRAREREMAARRAEHAAVPGVWCALVGVGRAPQGDDQPELPADPRRRHRLAPRTRKRKRTQPTSHVSDVLGGIGGVGGGLGLRVLRGPHRRARAGRRAAPGPVRLQSHTRQARAAALQQAAPGLQLGERPRPGRGDRAQGDRRHRSTAERARAACRDDDLRLLEWGCRARRDDVGFGWFRLCRGTLPSCTILL